tara:strand:- start:66 stop:287 length:222 start_codon:yes stop_codon:yes gene_type:complete
VVVDNIMEALRLNPETLAVLEVEQDLPLSLLEDLVVVVILLQQAHHKVKMVGEVVLIHKSLVVAAVAAVLMDK